MRRPWCLRATLALALPIWFAVALPQRSVSGQGQSPNGEALFATTCATCHDGSANSRAPSRDVLRQRSPAAILEILANGSMRVQGAKLSGPERRSIAEYLAGTRLGGDPTGASMGRCPTNPTFDLGSAPMWNGWGATVTNTRFQSASAAGLTADQSSGSIEPARAALLAASNGAQPSTKSTRTFPCPTSPRRRPAVSMR